MNMLKTSAFIALLGAALLAGFADAAKDKDAKEEPAKPAVAETKPLAVDLKPEAPAAAPQVAPDTVLVKVNDQSITQADLDGEINQIRQMMKTRGASPQQFDAMLRTIKPQITEGLIVRKLLAQECAREKVAVQPEETAREIASFQSSLKKNTTLDDFLKQSGITRETFEKDVNEQIKIEKLLKVSVPTDAEVKAYYEENKKNYEMPESVNARHILVSFDPADDAAKKEAKKKKAEGVREKLAKGGDFAKLAEENSDCPSKSKGGDLGEFSRGRMVPAFEEVAFTQKTNEISGVVETEFGYHIIQTVSHNQPRSLALEDVKGQIAFRLKSKKVSEKLEPLIKKLKDSAKIEYQKAGEDLKMPPPSAAGFPMMMPAGEKDSGKDKSAGEKPEKSGKDSSDQKDSPKKSD